MKKLIVKTLFFTLPFFTLFFLKEIYLVKDQGDLLRLGYFTTNYNYNSNILFKEEINRKKKYCNISEINLTKKNNFDILTLGDSFSELGSYSYQDYLSEYPNTKTLHYDRFLHENPIETINSLANSDFFDNIKVKYIILESVERYFTQRGQDVPKNNLLSIKDIQNKININKQELEKQQEKKADSKKPQFFSRDIIRFPLYNLYYNFSDNAFYSPTYKVNLVKNSFSVNNNNLLFFKEDLDFVNKFCEEKQILNTNNEINLLTDKLNKKGIKLILLVCPDKYEMYHDYFVEKGKYPEPIFFKEFNKLPKKYTFIQSKKILLEAIAKEKDIYYFDDTHWSPLAAKKIAKEIKNYIN